MKYFVFKTSGARWVWELRMNEGDVLARSPREFATLAQAIASIQLVQFAASGAWIVDADGRRLAWRA
ncbi:hypothetical protein [Variovorax sp. UMC13]|uniref:hypothetical protein n=1 Tax=Variovorax sp. UMC13 TaxID=1862326 RepID=UPI0016035D3B|nr:hypothetical protein [Variovorax sp. UMC13]MBB1601700.1 hypothetical protein [Variovorax sp. UMC13]